jgi:hypothetical protein
MPALMRDENVVDIPKTGDHKWRNNRGDDDLFNRKLRRSLHTTTLVFSEWFNMIDDQDRNRHFLRLQLQSELISERFRQ